MEKTLSAEEVEILIRTRGLSVARICREADINQATFQRWKNGSDMSLSTYNAIASAFHRLCESKNEPESVATE